MSFQWPFCSLCRRYRRAERSTSEEVDPITFRDCMFHVLKIIDTPVSASKGREQKVKELKLTHWGRKKQKQKLHRSFWNENWKCPQRAWLSFIFIPAVPPSLISRRWKIIKEPLPGLMSESEDLNKKRMAVHSNINPITPAPSSLLSLCAWTKRPETAPLARWGSPAKSARCSAGPR